MAIYDAKNACFHRGTARDFTLFLTSEFDDGPKFLTLKSRFNFKKTKKKDYFLVFMHIF